MSETLAARAERAAMFLDGGLHRVTHVAIDKQAEENAFAAATLRAIAAANAQLERERDEAKRLEVEAWDEHANLSAALLTAIAQRDAATSALAKAEGERDQLLEALRNTASRAHAALARIDAALTPAPEAPSDDR